MRRFLLSFSLWLAVSAVGLSVRAEPPWTVREHIPLGEFIVQAHRGAGELAEENTIEAFELGWSLGCIPEADVRTTKDGVIVPFHDATFARVVRGVDAETAKKGVGDVTFDVLSKLDVGSWKGERFSGRRVGPLRDVFAAMGSDPARRLYLDIKEVDLSQLAKEAAEAGVASRVILASTNYPIVRRWKALSPESKTLLWMGGSEDALLKRFEELRATDFADVDQLQIHTNLARPVVEIRRDSRDPFKEPDAFLIARGEELRRHGVLYQTLPWGGSTPEVYAKLLDLGFMSFATDHPKATWEAVRRYYQKD